MTVRHTNHGIREVSFFVAHAVIHRAVGRARHAFSNVFGAFVICHEDYLLVKISAVIIGHLLLAGAACCNSRLSTPWPFASDRLPYIGMA